jgi:hypothetical protein
MIVTEAHIFVWPGPDLRRPENTRDGYVYGSWPHAMMLRIKLGFAAWCVRKGIRAIWRGAWSYHPAYRQAASPNWRNESLACCRDKPILLRESTARQKQRTKE